MYSTRHHRTLLGNILNRKALKSCNEALLITAEECCSPRLENHQQPTPVMDTSKQPISLMGITTPFTTCILLISLRDDGYWKLH